MPLHPSHHINTQANPTSHHPVRTTDTRQTPWAKLTSEACTPRQRKNASYSASPSNTTNTNKFITDRLPACFAAAGHPVETSCKILDLYNECLPRKRPCNAGGLRPGPLSTRSAWTSSTPSMPVGVFGSVGYYEAMVG